MRGQPARKYKIVQQNNPIAQVISGIPYT